jgi:glycosyltransferase involved in cell wall biosynthesis
VTREIDGSVLILGPVEPPVGGVSRYCRGLAGLIGTGAVQVDLSKTSSKHLGIQRSPVAQLVKRVLGGPSFALRSAVTRHRPRLVVDNHPFLWRDPEYLDCVREVVSCPYALVIHDGAFPRVVDHVPSIESGPGWLSGAVCTSEPIRAALEKWAPGVQVTRLSPLLAGASRSDDTSWSEQLTGFLRRHESVIVTGGGVAEHYSLSDVLQASALLRERGREVGLVLLSGSFADDEPAALALRESVTRWGGESVLTLSDFPDGAALIARGDVYVRPSRVDNFGLGLHEAMQAGVPVVAARHETLPEGVTPYEPGNVEELASALEHALTPQAVAAARALVSGLEDGVERNRRQTLEFLSSLLR